MEDYRRKSSAESSEKEIVYSQSIKAGKRIYYLDVKKSRKDDMYLAITESKKIVIGGGMDEKVNFEKHKIFLYKEDFEKFLTGLKQAIEYIEERQGDHNFRNLHEETAFETSQTQINAGEEEISTPLESNIKLDIEF